MESIEEIKQDTRATRLAKKNNNKHIPDFVLYQGRHLIAKQIKERKTC